MKKLIVMLLALTVMLSAALVDQSRATKLAETHYQTYAPSEALKGGTVQRILPRMYDGQVTMYTVVFDEGFVIVNAEDNLKPILGYSYETIKEIPEDFIGGPAFESWFGNYDKQIVEARQAKYVNTDAVAEWKKMETGEFTKGAKSVVISPLIESHWTQEYPYNDQCPSLSETGYDHVVVGCVATASSQVMRYHEQDVVGYGSSSYYWSTGGETLSIDHSTQTFDYSLMPYSGYDTQDEVDELAKLAVNWGRAVSMDYDTRDNGGSGAYSTDVDDAFLDHFGYTTADYYYHGTPSSSSPSWTSRIETSLDNMLPIVYSGSGDDGGHCFNLDGYSTDNWYHFNWGWGGYYDGSFQLDNLNPDSEFSESQSGIYNIEAGAWAWNDPTNFSGSLANGEDVTLTWTVPTANTKVQTGYNIYRNGTLYDTVGIVTSYDDSSLSPADYEYYIKAVYEDGLSHMTVTYSVSVVVDENYPVATAVAAVTMGRTSIDVSWAAPFVGEVFYSEDFESTEVSTVWNHERTFDYPATGARYDGTRDNFNKTDITDGWGLLDATSFGGDNPEYIHAGTYSMGLGYTVGNGDDGTFTWTFSPEFTLATGDDASLTYWVWCQGNTTYQSNYYVNLYSGDFSETNPSSYLDELAAYVNIGTDIDANEYETMITHDLSSYTGTYRLAFTYEYTDGYQMMIDDIIVGSSAKKVETVAHKHVVLAPVERLAEVLYPVDDSSFSTNTSSKAGKADSPTAFQVYRNGSLAYTTVDATTLTYSDAGFDDGDNEYFIKTVFAGGTSLASVRASEYIIANPVPGYLTGVLNANLADVDLEWYAPLSLPAHWYGFINDLDATFDAIDGMDGDWAKRRTLYTATDLGMTYPITVDSLAAAFYQGDATWTDDDFTFTVYTSATDGTDSILMATTNDLTAVSDTWTTYAIGSTLTMNMGWYVEVGVNIDGTPTCLVSTTTDATNSSVYYGGDTTYDPNWYNITFGDDAGNWAIISYGEGSDQTWYYSKEEAPAEQLAMSFYKELPVVTEEVSTPVNNKSLVQYNIYRNGSVVDNTTNKYYTDVAAPGGDNIYAISAAYSTPTGESATCTSVTVTVPVSSAPDTPANVVTSIVSDNLQVDWDVSANATGYSVYSSDDPYGTFTLVTSVATNQYTVAISDAKLFYYIIATN